MYDILFYVIAYYVTIRAILEKAQSYLVFEPK